MCRVAQLRAQKFQSTRPRGARLCCASRSGCGACRFNPRAHAGRDLHHVERVTVRRVVSIHAPTRGATFAVVDLRPAFAVSIHAPTRGATGRGRGLRCCCGQFQSTRPRGARPDRHRQERAGGAVSIHAPTRGATWCACSQWLSSHQFQSTRPRGARPAWRVRSPPSSWFQSTRPRGARRMAGADRQGVDGVSIHAPTRGATRKGWASGASSAWFQSTRPRGARRNPDRRCAGDLACFNPRAHAGRDATCSRSAPPTSVSICQATP